MANARDAMAEHALDALMTEPHDIHSDGGGDDTQTNGTEAPGVALSEASVTTTTTATATMTIAGGVKSGRALGELQLMETSTMGLSDAESDHAGDQFLSTGLSSGSATDQAETAAPAPLAAAVSTSVDLRQLQPELVQWMEQCRIANEGLAASEDDILYYLDTYYPELVHPDATTCVFEWLLVFLSGFTSTYPPRFSKEVKEMAVHTAATPLPDPSALVTELGLKSPTTLLFWRYQQDLQANPARSGKDKQVDRTSQSQMQSQGTRRRWPFLHEKELVDWIVAQKNSPITNQDIVAHVMAHYPEFVEGRTSASISVWVARFLKRHLPSETSTNVGTGATTTDVVESAHQGAGVAPAVASTAGSETSTKAAERPRKRREKRGSPEGYVLHSNEFKLNALKKLDEGKTINEVAEELGLKCANTLVYWNSIRDKLAVADKKRFRLAGGGRRSTCTFEDELMNWVSERHQKGVGTDVKSVLDYMREFHSSFTDGKKEPTLRKWILRFFKRWRQPSLCTGAEPDDDLDKTAGILV